jgi:Insertion element 4 transposase N-terminal/Transposase DDE domain
MQLKEFSLVSLLMASREILKAVETAIPEEAIEQVLRQTDSRETRKRKLASHLVVCLVIAMSIWSSDSMPTVRKNLVQGLRMHWLKLGWYWRIPSPSSITEARQRLGCRAMSQLFQMLVRPLATPETPEAFLFGLRVMAADRTVLDVTDTPVNAKVLGYPGSRHGTRAAFPKIRLVLLIEAGTHLIVDALRCPDRLGERVRVKKLLRSVRSGMLLMWDRGLHSYQMVPATQRQGCHFLGRVPKNVNFVPEQVWDDGSYLAWIHPDGKSKKKGCSKTLLRVIEYTMETEPEQKTYRLITSLLDPHLYPALVLAREYHQRWEV